MSDALLDLNRFARRVYSESGEDGIIEAIFSRLDVDRGFFVEFGAWDGVRLSNTRLLAERGWAGILIEADAAKFSDLQRNALGPPVTLVQATVALQGENALDSILEHARCPAAFELLSIDVDSDDLAIWMSLRRHRPLCVVIEFNITIPFDVDYINPPGRAWGNSARTICKVGRSKGYELVAITKMNLVFVDTETCGRAGFKPVSLDAARLEVGERLFWGYDGTLIRWRPRFGTDTPEFLPVPFHRYLYPQPMPRLLRRWQLGHERRRLELGTSVILAALTRPLSWARSLRRRR